MGRQRSPNREEAFKIYKRHKGNIKNKAIAEILGEDPKTVSKWKTLDEWDKKIGISKEDKKKSKNEKNKTSSLNAFEENPQIEMEIVDIPETRLISQKHLEFCIEYTKCFNATKAYKKVYGCSSNAAAVSGSLLLRDPKIRITIEKLKQNKLNQMMLAPEDIFQKYMDIAFADISDYMEFGVEEIEIAEGQKISIDYARLKNDACEVDSTIVKEVKAGKYGVSIKLEDRMAALRWLADHISLATEEQKARVESLRNKVRIENERLELEKSRFERDDF